MASPTPGVARRRLDDRAARTQLPLALGGLDHRHADAILVRAARIQELELGEQRRAGLAPERDQPHDRGVPDQVEDGRVVAAHGAGSLPSKAEAQRDPRDQRDPATRIRAVADDPGVASRHTRDRERSSSLVHHRERPHGRSAFQLGRARSADRGGRGWLAGTSVRRSAYGEHSPSSVHDRADRRRSRRALYG